MLFYVIFYYMQAFPSIWLPVLFWKLSSLTSTPLLLAKRKLGSGNSSLWQTLAGNSLDLSAFFLCYSLDDLWRGPSSLLWLQQGFSSSTGSTFCLWKSPPALIHLMDCHCLLSSLRLPRLFSSKMSPTILHYLWFSFGNFQCKVFFIITSLY